MSRTTNVGPSVRKVPAEAGTIFFFAASQLPFAIWLMKNFMDGVPIELEEAALIDGCSRVQALLRIVFPISLPGILTGMALNSFFVFRIT